MKLLKLYDKASNLLDGSWMNDVKWNAYVRHTLRRADQIERRHGALDVVKIARAIPLPA